MIKNDEVLEKYEICNVIKNKIGIKQQNKKKFKISWQKKFIRYNNYGVLIKNFINDFF